MEYLVGIAVAFGVGLFTTVAGFDRDRSLYPVILLVISSYYGLFAIMGGSTALNSEIGVFAVFAVAATVGLRANLWIVAFALVGHGILDWYHSELIENAGVPTWWPMFCLGFDATAGAYLAWRLYSGKIEAADPTSFSRRIHAYVEAELAVAKSAEMSGDLPASFRRLERAHVLGQSSTVQHVRIHMRMLMWGIRRHDLREVIGQIGRVVGASVGTWAGLVPHGNTGGANVSWSKPMAIPDDLARQIAEARSSLANFNGLSRP